MAGRGGNSVSSGGESPVSGIRLNMDSGVRELNAPGGYWLGR